ncbi:hypothetical protein VFPPC_14848 [Pochonia chlamydosporia 170]|uniref:Uncharacterized protein n=1 Tax=Pochonia chlamydosporia 170 TaxID=1380566 RepID=A0A179F0K0_METCM|nr:hypothetical protein VFPPC_14848 [Pochonia chlamydosporia 170]OAQ58679.1 hypothetical protein VFPPC_14848 [Pochonia chlamydosporia 170]
MRVCLLLFVTTIFLGIAKADLRHAKQNIVYFLAYRLELYMDEADRIIGVKCASADYSTHRCLDPPDGKPKYKHCKGTVSTVIRGRTIPYTCNLREFLSHISGNKGYRKGDPLDGGEKKNYRDETLLGRRVGENTLDFDVDYAAHNMNNKGIGNLKTEEYCMVKDGQEFLPSIDKIARRVGEVKEGMSASEINEHGPTFKGLDAAVDGIVIERRGDHEKALIQQLNKVSPEFKVSVKNLSPGRQVLEYELTMDRVKAGAPNTATYELRKRLLDNVIAAYEAAPESQKHVAPIKKWQLTKDLMVPVKGCALRPPPKNIS